MCVCVWCVWCCVCVCVCVCVCLVVCGVCARVHACMILSPLSLLLSICLSSLSLCFCAITVIEFEQGTMCPTDWHLHSDVSNVSLDYLLQQEFDYPKIFHQHRWNLVDLSRHRSVVQPVCILVCLYLLYLCVFACPPPPLSTPSLASSL